MCKCSDCCKKLALANAAKLGLDGTDGATWHRGNGVPNGALGNLNDFYLDLDNGDVYQKTGIATWTLEGNLVGPPGADGADGTNGTNGTNARTTLYNNLAQTDSGNKGGVTTVFVTNNIPANTLVNNGDSVNVQVVVACNSSFPNAYNGFSKVNVGATLAGMIFYSVQGQVVVHDITIDRISSTTYLLTVRQTDSVNSQTGVGSVIVTGANFAAVIPVTVLANTSANTGGYIVCRKSFAEYKPI